MKKILKSSCLLVCLFLTQMVFAQPDKLVFDKIRMEGGSDISANVKTWLGGSDGYVWIGTPNGVVRYNGYTTKHYKFTDEKAKPIRAGVASMYEDRKGVVWIYITYNGLYRFDRIKDAFVKIIFPSAFKELEKTESISIISDKREQVWFKVDSCLYLLTPDNKIEKFGAEENGIYKVDSYYRNPFADSDGNVWVFANGGLLKYDQVTRRFQDMHLRTRIPDKFFNSIINESPYEPGILWIRFMARPEKNVASLYLVRYDTKTGSEKEFRQNDGGGIQTFVEGIAGTPDHRIWATTREDGLLNYDNTTGKFISKYKGSYVNLLLPGIDGLIWCGMMGSHIGCYNTLTGTFRDYHFTPSEDGTNGPVTYTDFMADRSGNIFLAYNDIYRINRKRSRFSLFTNVPGDKNSYPGGQTNGITQTPDSAYWLLTSKGLVKWQRGVFSLIKSPIPVEHFEESMYLWINHDSKGRVWVSTNSGLNVYDPSANRWSNYNQKIIAVNASAIYCMYEDRSGVVWMGSDHGPLRLNDDNTFTKFRHNDYSNRDSAKKGDLVNGYVNILTGDSKNDLWVGNQNGGLNMFEKATQLFTHFDEKNYYSVTAVYEDSKKRLWVGTIEGGLYLADREHGKMVEIIVPDAFYSGHFTSINEDAKGFLWLGVASGLARFDPDTKQVTMHKADDGFTAMGQTAYMDRKGKLLFGTPTGIMVMDPAEITKDTLKPITVIEEIHYPSKTKKTDGSYGQIVISFPKDTVLSFTHDQNNLQFEYAGMQYANPKANRYKYRLEGYQPEWIDAGTERKAAYTNLAPGKYTFLVKSSNADGVWNETPATISFIISPPWWKTWWAYLIYVLAFGGLIAWYIRFRSRKLHEENRMLEEKVTDRTAQLKQSIEELKQTQEQLIQSEKLASLGELTAGIAHEIQNPLNFINNFSEVSVELSAEMKEELDKGNLDDAKAIASDIEKNLEKINYHGKRADSIVKNMLQHSRQSNGQKETVDINALADEYMRLSYHGLRAKDKSFNAELEKKLDPAAGMVSIMTQDIGRVLLNLFNNAFYATTKRKQREGDSYQPTVTVQTQRKNNEVVISVHDNGTGIPPGVKEKVFQPFFTTKPTGEGTGLGLSLSYDIVTKMHHGKLEVRSEEGKFTEFIITLPVA